MPHGTPDWGLVGPKETLFGLDDLGEHAVRMGSPHLWDRRGDVVWQTAFDHGMGDLGTWGLPGYDVRLVTGTAPRQGSYCLDLYYPKNGIGWTGIRKWLPYPVVSRMGLEGTFSTDHYNAYWQFLIYIRRGTTELQGEIRYDVVGGNLECLIGLNTYHPFATALAPALLNVCNQTLKMVIDAATEQYVRVIFNEVEYSLTGVPCYIRPLVAARRSEALIAATCVEDKEMHAYLDCVIVTQNEP